MQQVHSSDVTGHKSRRTVACERSSGHSVKRHDKATAPWPATALHARLHVQLYLLAPLPHANIFSILHGSETSVAEVCVQEQGSHTPRRRAFLRPVCLLEPSSSTGSGCSTARRLGRRNVRGGCIRRPCSIGSLSSCLICERLQSPRRAQRPFHCCYRLRSTPAMVQGSLKEPPLWSCIHPLPCRVQMLQDKVRACEGTPDGCEDLASRYANHESGAVAPSGLAMPSPRCLMAFIFTSTY